MFSWHQRLLSLISQYPTSLSSFTSTSIFYHNFEMLQSTIESTICLRLQHSFPSRSLWDNTLTWQSESITDGNLPLGRRFSAWRRWSIGKQSSTPSWYRRIPCILLTKITATKVCASLVHLQARTRRLDACLWTQLCRHFDWCHQCARLGGLVLALDRTSVFEIAWSNHGANLTESYSRNTSC